MWGARLALGQREASPKGDALTDERTRLAPPGNVGATLVVVLSDERTRLAPLQIRYRRKRPNLLTFLQTERRILEDSVHTLG